MFLKFILTAGGIMKLRTQSNLKIYKKVSLLVLIIIVTGFIIRTVAAQSSGPVYIVQPGDTLLAIANRFNVTLNDLLTANPSIDPNLLAQGQQIIIPGLEGITGILDT